MFLTNEINFSKQDLYFTKNSIQKYDVLLDKMPKKSRITNISINWKRVPISYSVIAKWYHYFLRARSDQGSSPLLGGFYIIFNLWKNYYS